jgi:N-acetylmuramoyl-L-alanine amidase
MAASPKRKINWIIIHQSASNHPEHDNIDTIKQWHLDRGFSDVGYHYFIRKDGTIEKGRDESKKGAHVKDHNSSSLGICLSGEGNTEKEKQLIAKEKDPEKLKKMIKVHPTEDQLKALEVLLIDICSRHDLEKKDILGHKDLAPTECPGFDLHGWLSSRGWH